jgi:DNA-binding NtrC family response regulator
MEENEEKQDAKSFSTDEINIIIADDEMKTCEEIEAMLKEYSYIKIIGIANTDEEEIRMIEELKPDVAVTDLMRRHQFTGLDIIKDYAEKENSPKFIIVSFASDESLCYRYKNIACSLEKYPKTNGAKLAYKILCAKRMLIVEEQKKEEKRLIEANKKSGFLSKIKELFFNLKR